MELWDAVMGPSKPEFERLGAVAKLRVSVEAIKHTAESSPIADDEARQLVADIIATLESSLTQNVGAVPMPPEIDERIDEVHERIAEPGVSSIVMACVRCFTRESELTANAVFNTLGACYNAVVEQEFAGPFIEIEDEESNARCQATIEFQQDLLERNL